MISPENAWFRIVEIFNRPAAAEAPRGGSPWRRFLVAALLLAGSVQLAAAGGWYVANTAATEWVRYKQVYFSAGSYRFTARAGAPAAGATMHLEIDGVTVQSGISVPNTGRADAFAYVHLGHTTVTAGYHDLKVVFDSAGVSLDWFMLSKDTDTSSSVKTADYTMVRPDTGGLVIAPVVAFGHVTASTGLASALSNYVNGANALPCTDAAVQAWYAIPMYRDYDRRTDRYWDVMVDELMASRAQVPLFHCRETKDLTSNLQDRAYQNGPGDFEGRWLLKFAEAVARNPQAKDALKIGMFWENGGIADLFNTRYGYLPSWGDPALVDYVMTYHLSPWFDSVPASMLYQPIAGRPIIYLFSNHPDDLVDDGKMADFVAAVRDRLQKKYGYNPLFILPTGGNVNSAVEAQGWGQAGWGVWDGPCVTPNVFKGQTWATSCDGARRRIDTVWNNDWNPATNTGTPGGSSPGHDSFQDRQDSAGHSRLLTNYAQANSLGTKFILQEGFTNLAEGNSIYRSFHPGFSFPNQHIAATREYADPSTKTALFEAESCDDYFKVVNDGNSGGSFRSEWYSQGNNLDVFRPLHNQQGWLARSTGPGNLSQINAGFFDTWTVATDGKVWAQPISGSLNTWTQVTSGSPPLFSSISLSKAWAWGISTAGAVYSAGIPYGWPNASSTTGWTSRSNTATVTQLSVGISEVWGVNASGQVYRRPADGTSDWQLMSGGSMDKVWMGDSFVWGMQSTNIYCARVPAAGATSVTWTSIANPNSITKIAVGSEEVWGVNAAGNLYRRSISGIGGWDAVTSPGGTVTSLAVGENYVCAMVGTTPYTCRLEGFVGAVPLAPMIDTVVSGSGQATLTWTATSAATGYNIKRGTTSGGPYTTVAANVMPFFTTAYSYTNSSLANNTTYYYVVSALTPAGETGNSAEVVAMPQGSAPSAPSTLTAAIGFGSVITLNWIDTANNDAGFEIERKADAGSFVPIASLPRNATSFTDTTNLMGPAYTYRVHAYNAAGNSTNSNEATATTSTRLLSRTGWVATASASAGGPTSNALDGSSTTRWSPGVAQANGQWLQIDMGAVYALSQIDMTSQGADNARSYALYLSMDGTNWGNAVTAGSGYQGTTSLTFSPKSARYFRIVQTGSAATNWWSVNEVNAYGQAPGALPSPWATSDIGSVGLVGNGYFLSPSYILEGAGGDISGSADAFRYVYQTSSGDCTMVARVSSQQNTNVWAKAGVMLRATTSADAMNAALLVTNGALNFQWRTATGGATSTTGGGALAFPDVWLKLVRTGNSISAYKSSDGTTWTQVGTAQTIALPASATMGLADTAHTTSVTSTATFDNVTAAP